MDLRSFKSGVKFFFTQPKNFIGGAITVLSPIIPEPLHLAIVFKRQVGYWPNLKDPKTFNEKLNWLKLHNRKDEYTMMVDKYAVKQYIQEKIGAEYVVPYLGIYDSVDEIDEAMLPNQFVIKTTHNSCATFVCKDKGKFDFVKAKADIRHAQGKNLYDAMGEWPYKNVPPRIIVEEFLDDGKDNELQDYKWWCFNGEPQFMYFSIKRKEVYENFYDMDFNPVTWINHNWPRRVPEFDKPTGFEEMKRLAKVLSADIPFVRVDFYEVNGRVYFGELTFFDYAGMRPFASYEIDLKLGDLLKLPVRGV